LANTYTTLVEALKNAVQDVFAVESVTYQEPGPTVTMRGRLQQDAESAYNLLRERFRLQGYVPILRQERGEHVLHATPAPAVGAMSPPWVHLLLLLATIGTTIWVGAEQAATAAFLRFDPRQDPLQLVAGVPFSFALLAILGMHELGHYMMARRHGMAVTLPYFIPVPIGLGTFGAVIRMKSPIESRKALFDIGVAGPLVGLAVAFPIYLLGLSLSSVRGIAFSPYGDSLLVSWLNVLFHGTHARGWFLVMHPIAFAGWLGFLVTAVNLLPVGQLDGGHIAYAVLGRAYNIVATATTAVMLLLGLLVWQGWLVWAFLPLLIGRRHPPPLNEITSLDTKRKVLGLVMFGLLLLLISPVPIRGV